MATHFEIVDEFDCSVDEYWRIFWDEEFSSALYASLKSQRRVTELTDHAGKIIRIQEVEPSQTLPPTALAVLGSAGVLYREEGEFTKPHGPLVVRATMRALGDKFSLEGLYSTEPLGQNRCRRKFAGECSLRVPLVGRKMEELLIGQMRASYETASRIHRMWITKSQAEAQAGA